MVYICLAINNVVLQCIVGAPWLLSDCGGGGVNIRKRHGDSQYSMYIIGKGNTFISSH